MLIINQLKVKLSDNRSLKNIVSQKLKTSEENIVSCDVIRRSVDARKKDDILFVYNVVVDLKDESRVLGGRVKNVSSYEQKVDEDTFKGLRFDKKKKVAIIGFGPAGMFSALKLSNYGINVSVFERGEDVEKRFISVTNFNSNRVLNTESNIQFGEGGAGTFSDGKLTNRGKDKRAKWLFEEFVKAGAPEEIMYVQNPHIGTDKLVNIVKNVREKIISLGSSVLFNSKVTNVVPYKKGVNITVNGTVQYFDYVVLAIGHSSRDTIEMLYKNKVNLESKPFAVGLRIEHRQTDINKAQYGPNYNNPKLDAAEYKLTHQTSKGKGVYTFCMCPGGLVVPAASEENTVVVNGMSEYKRDKVNANSALLVTVNKDDFKSHHPLAGIKFQRDLEKKAFELGGSNYNAPIQLVDDYMNNKVTTNVGKVLPSYSVGYKYANLRELFSNDVNDAFIESIPKLGNKLKGFNSKDALLSGVESRSSSPVRILRDRETMQSTNIEGLYPTGEGAGYAGGIVSAAVDGIKVAEKILDKLILKWEWWNEYRSFKGSREDI
mgnify:CR=1 FL=1